ncbi:hypothetical protein SCP_1701650 [Sparassis crispa]|uniref:Uncharacterized protein n=1 Tax=Sparassis crispa TaxID=139825 RepID=A0A401H657_9APHY|nr:hypothetical protein SCP_1701650 [Sparassis crispa]GBE89840.1 hypothetical protein SCP_1701650 [Sparassis crispa]
MPVIRIDDSNSDLSDMARNFGLLYRELWKSNGVEKRNVFLQQSVSVRVDLWDMMESRGSVESDNNSVSDIPGSTFDYTLLDLSWLPRPIAGSAQKILIRQEYLEAMAAFHEDEDPVLLTGQPGIGKTLFLVYALVKRLTEGQPTIFSTAPLKYYLFQNSGAYRFTSADMDGSTLRSAILDLHNGVVPGGNFTEEDAGWILYDSNAAQGPLIWDSEDFLPWKMVFSTLPKLSRYKEWVKQKNAVMYVMKPWSWSEICAGAPLQTSGSRTTKELWDAYHRFGPSARIVYKSDHVEHRNDICFALRNCRDPSILFPQNEAAWDESSNVLVVVEPATIDGVVHRNMLTGKIATPYIMNMVHEEAEHLLGLAMRRTYQHLLADNISRGAAGIVFEDMAHHLLGGTASCTRSLRTLPRGGTRSTTKRKDLTMNSSVIFDSIAQISGNVRQRTYYRPLPHFAGIDSFALIDGTLVLFQFTITADHPVKVKGLESIQTLFAEQPIEREWMLIFVVPTAIEPDFKRQLLQPDSSRREWDQNVDQCVMGLTLEELFPTDIHATKTRRAKDCNELRRRGRGLRMRTWMRLSSLLQAERNWRGRRRHICRHICKLWRGLVSFPNVLGGRMKPSRSWRQHRTHTKVHRPDVGKGCPANRSNAGYKCVACAAISRLLLKIEEKKNRKNSTVCFVAEGSYNAALVRG